MWKKLDMLNEDDFNFFLEFMTGYTCLVTHHNTYGIKKMKNLLSPYRIKEENIGVFYYDDGHLQILIGVMDHIKDKNTVWAWATESRGINTSEDLDNYRHIYYKFVRDYLISSGKTKLTTGICWKDLKPSYKVNFKEDDSFLQGIESIGHKYLNFTLDLEKVMLFELKNDDC